jgi:hypothetical protein
MDLPKKPGRENMSHIEDPMEIEYTPSNQVEHMSHVSGPASEFGSKERECLNQAFIEMRLEDKKEEDRGEDKLDKDQDKVEYETVVLPDGGLGRIINGVTYVIFLDEYDNEQLVPLDDKFLKFMQELADEEALKPQPQP